MIAIGRQATVWETNKNERMEKEPIVVYGGGQAPREHADHRLVGGTTARRDRKNGAAQKERIEMGTR